MATSTGVVRPEVDGGRSRSWDLETFTKEQVRGLVRQIFFPGWPRPLRQVVFSSIDCHRDIAHVCVRVAEDLATQVPGKICMVEANLRSPGLQNYVAEMASENGCPTGTSEPLAESSIQVSGNLWLMPAASFLGESLPWSVGWLRARLGELRREFDYAVIHAPPAGFYNEAALLGHLCDGVILVLQAHATRRIAAKKTKEILQAANVRLLGTVLDQRTFPIPEGIYRRL